jgi:hypothetical protein
MCYKHRAVEDAVKQELAPPATEQGDATTQVAVPGVEDASQYCPVCSQQLESRRCKLICSVCGYYMSCSDYY